MTIYNYNEEMIFSSATEARLDREETRRQGRDRFLIPKRATTVAPPTLTGNEVAIFDEDTETWTITEDHRLTEYWLPDEWDYPNPIHMVTELGPLPEGALLTRPPTPIEIIEEEQAEANAIAMVNPIRAAFEALNVNQQKIDYDNYTRVLQCIFDGNIELASAFADDIVNPNLKRSISLV